MPSTPLQPWSTPEGPSIQSMSDGRAQDVGAPFTTFRSSLALEE